MASPIKGISTHQSPQIKGNQADPTVIASGNVKDRLAQLQGQPGMDHLLPSPPKNLRTADLPPAPLHLLSPPSHPPLDLPPTLTSLDDGSFLIVHSDETIEHQIVEPKPEANKNKPTPPPKPRISLPKPKSVVENHQELNDLNLAKHMALAIEASQNAPKKIKDRFEANMQMDFVIDRSNEASDAVLATKIAEIEAAGYEYHGDGDFWMHPHTNDIKLKDDLTSNAASRPSPAPMPLNLPSIDPQLDAKIKEIEAAGYIFSKEGDFWYKGDDIKTKDDLLLSIKQSAKKTSINPLQMEINKLLVNGFADVDGAYYNSSTDTFKTSEDLQTDLIQEVNAAAKALGYFFDPSAGKTGLDAIYRNSNGQSMDFGEVYEKFVNINSQI